MIMFFQANGVHRIVSPPSRRCGIHALNYGIPLYFDRLDKKKACNNRQNYYIVILFLGLLSVRCMKKILAIPFLVLAILAGIVAMLVGAVWLLEYSETSESHFETYQQLEESELIGKGWVPSFIPRSAYDIHEKHKVDVGRVNVKFRFRPGDTKEIEARCTKVKTDESIHSTTVANMLRTTT